jgi:alpha-glucosidase
LRRSIGKSLNLALSGIPFNGADVGGFGGHCSEALLVDWFKAAFLMPFFRNHTMQGSRAQEPWAYSRRALGIIRRFVRLRYRLLPYLYNLFIDQEACGEAILRPLFYDFDDTPSLALGVVDDQFMVGPAIMQAPFVRKKNRQRTVVLPEGRWFRADTGRWIQGGRRLRIRRQAASSPVFLREGSLVAFQPGERTSNRSDLKRIGLLGCLSPKFSGCARLDYRADDGLSFDYRRGRRTRVAIEARLKAQRLELKLATRAGGFGRVQVTFYSLNRFREVLVTNRGQKRSLRPSKETVRLTGKKFHWYRWRPAIAV